ncbi:MAG: histone deacetylase [Acidobacteria bacterium]|nr:histone deacetylase [Acidobacteriota bacterium]
MLTLIHSNRFADHLTPPGHPERPGRAEAMAAAVNRFRAGGGVVAEPRRASDDDLVRVHSRQYVDAISGTRGRAVMLDPDTFTSPDSDDVARLAAGAVLDGVDLAMDGPSEAHALAVVRPPGHHAEADRAMGFCLYNNIAVGAAYARSRGAGRVAIVDYDVHHGNGTQGIFYDDPTVLYISSHQFPFYPGTGAANETGCGPGVGFTLNLPLEAGAGDEDVMSRYQGEALPALDAFRPDLLLISAGFDAHERDPLGGCRMTTGGFRRLTAMLIEAAGRLCDGRAVMVTEGGYDLTTLGECLDAVIDAAR